MGTTDCCYYSLIIWNTHPSSIYFFSSFFLNPRFIFHWNFLVPSLFTGLSVIVKCPWQSASPSSTTQITLSYQSELDVFEWKSHLLLRLIYSCSLLKVRALSILISFGNEIWEPVGEAGGGKGDVVFCVSLCFFSWFNKIQKPLLIGYIFKGLCWKWFHTVFCLLKVCTPIFCTV